MTAADVARAAHALAERLEVDEDADVLRWCEPDGTRREVGLHDYAALYAVRGLYEAAFMVRLRGGSPQLLVDVLAGCVPAGERAAAAVLDVGAGSGVVGDHLREAGFGRVCGVDIEPAAERAVRRDRSDVYGCFRTLDLVALGDDDVRWLTQVAPDVVTVAGALGYGHLPAAAFSTLTRLLPAGGLLALTAAPELDVAPALEAHSAVLRGPQWRERASQSGVHRMTADGGSLPVLALVLERTREPA